MKITLTRLEAFIYRLSFHLLYQARLKPPLSIRQAESKQIIVGTLFNI